MQGFDSSWSSLSQFALNSGNTSIIRFIITQEGSGSCRCSQRFTGKAGKRSPQTSAAGYDGTHVLIQFLTESNMTYQLQASTNLIEGIGWEDVSGASTIGDGGVGILKAEPALPVRYMRLRGY